jgi:hypothetical protein
MPLELFAPFRGFCLYILNSQPSIFGMTTTALLTRPVLAILLLAAGLVSSLAQNATNTVTSPAHDATNTVTTPVKTPSVKPADKPVLEPANKSIPAEQTASPAEYPSRQLRETELPSQGVATTPALAEPGPVLPYTGASAGAPLAGTSQLGGAPPLAAYGAGAPDTPFRWGRLAFRPHFSDSVSYGNSLSYSAGEQANTWIEEFSPGILINLGEHWTLDYTPTLRWYSDSRFTDGVDHSVFLQGQTTFGGWNFGLSQGFSESSQPLIETGAQTKEETYPTSLSAGGALNGRLSLSLGLFQNLRFLGADTSNQGLTDSKSWSTMNWLDYLYVQRLSFGLGAGFTYDNVQFGSDMTSEQVQARTRWIVENKLSLSLSGGLDIRQFLDSKVSGMVSPIFSLTAAYQLFKGTALSLGASTGVSPSYYSATVSKSTGLSAAVNQRILGRLFLSVNGGYSISDYSSSVNSGSGSGSNQESYSFGISLSTAFLKRASASIFYNKSFNKYGSDSYNYSPQTVGAQVSYRF